MAKLMFEAAALRELWNHAKEAPDHRQGFDGSAEPALLLVKDEGIYLMSNGVPHLPHKRPAPNGSHDIDCSKVCYAHGFDPTKQDRMDVWDRAREAVGGHDFAEPIGADVWDAMLDNPKVKRVEIDVTAERMEFSAYSA